MDEQSNIVFEEYWLLNPDNLFGVSSVIMALLHFIKHIENNLSVSKI